jgi:type II secretory pathway component PulF
VALPESLEISAQAAANSRLMAEARRGAAAIREGERASRAFGRGGAFTPAARWSLGIAEERGDFEDTLASLADYYDEAADIGATTFLAAAEPMAIAVIGIVAAATILAVALNTLQLYTLVW